MSSISDNLQPRKGAILPGGITYQYDEGEGWMDDQDVPQMYPSDYCGHFAHQSHPRLFRARVLDYEGSLLFLRWYRPATNVEWQEAMRRGESESEFQTWRCEPMEKWRFTELIDGVFE